MNEKIIYQEFGRQIHSLLDQRVWNTLPKRELVLRLLVVDIARLITALSRQTRLDVQDVILAFVGGRKKLDGKLKKIIDASSSADQSLSEPLVAAFKEQAANILGGEKTVELLLALFKWAAPKKDTPRVADK